MVEHQNVSYMKDEYLGQFLKSSEPALCDNWSRRIRNSTFENVKTQEKTSCFWLFFNNCSIFNNKYSSYLVCIDNIFQCHHINVVFAMDTRKTSVFRSNNQLLAFLVLMYPFWGCIKWTYHFQIVYLRFFGAHGRILS